MDTQQLLQLRDEKARPHLEQYAPVWIVDQKIIDEDQAVQFNAIFQHNLYGWVSRRYRYDGFNDVLYHKGQRTISEEQALTFQEQEPYLAIVVNDIPNAYGG
ncbi:MAG: hypothetical protein SF162_04480 [bacterium]|nr:hypothetical protein [bacterium]